MVHELKFIFLITLFIFSELASSQDLQYIDEDENINSQILFQIVGEIGLPVYTIEERFLDDYKRILNDDPPEFQKTFVYSLGLRLRVLEKVNLKLSTTYYEMSLYDNYFKPYNENTSNGRIFEQDIRFTEFLNYLHLEIIPYYRSQFRTFFSLGLGASYSTLYWDEKVDSDQVSDFRTGDTWINDMLINPGFKFTFGTELNFDKYGRKSILGGLIFSISVNRLFRNIQFFNNASEQLIRENIEGINNSYFINNFLVEIDLGFTLNFYNNQR